MNSPSSLSVRRLTFYGRLLLLTLVCVAILAPSPGTLGAARAAAAAQADLVVSKSGDETVALGGQITYSLTVFNSGPDDATGVVLTDPLPAHTSFVSASTNTGTASFDGSTLTVNVGTLAAFDTATAMFVVSVDTDTPGARRLGRLRPLRRPRGHGHPRARTLPRRQHARLQPRLLPVGQRRLAADDGQRRRNTPLRRHHARRRLHARHTRQRRHRILPH